MRICTTKYVIKNSVSYSTTVLVNFIEDALGLEDAKGIEFQRVHRMGKPRSGSGNGSRSIIFFLAFRCLILAHLVFLFAV